VTLAPKGLLIEEQRTNLLTYSEQFDNAAWTKTRSSITANATTSPDGTVDADKLVEDTSVSNTHQINASVTVTANTTYTFSVYVKAAERTGVRLIVGSGIDSINATYNLLTQAISSVTNGGTGSGAVASIFSVGNGWLRLVLSGIPSTTATTVSPIVRLLNESLSVSYTGDGTSGIYIWGAQLEAGAFATSYIPTVASQVTRAADVAVMTGANFSNWYNQSEGTLFVAAIEKPDTVTRIFASITDGTTEGYAIATFNNTGRIRAQNVSSGGIGTTVTGQPFKIGYSFESGAQSGSLNSSAIVTTSTTVTVVPTMFRIGSNQSATSFWCSHISRIAFFPRRLSNTELIGITS
jgi:hypothetical protein